MDVLRFTTDYDSISLLDDIVQSDFILYEKLVLIGVWQRCVRAGDFSQGVQITTKDLAKFRELDAAIIKKCIKELKFRQVIGCFRKSGYNRYFFRPPHLWQLQGGGKHGF